MTEISAADLCSARQEHRPPEGPNEDVAICQTCGTLTFEHRPSNETFGLHLSDCSLPIGHYGRCEPGGEGHPPAEHIRGWWATMEEDIAAERERWGQT